MAFIKAQKIIRDENGVITSGSAAIVDTVYISTGSKNHSKHNVREKLGKVLYLSKDRKSGIFMSPTRGLVEYNALTDTFEGVEMTAGSAARRYFLIQRSTQCLVILSCCCIFWKNAVSFRF